MGESIKWYGNQEPISLRPDGRIITYRNSAFYCVNMEGKAELLCSMDTTMGDGLKDCLRIVQRLLRRDIRCSCVDTEWKTYFFRKRNLYSLDFEKAEIKNIYTLNEKQSAPLNMTCTIVKSRYILLWGDYSGNDNRRQVNIYGLTNKQEVEVIYTFSEGQVRHIHNIVPDLEGGYYVLTGDNDKSAGIYHADEGFKDVKPLYIGEQRSRAVQGFSTPEGFLYATDSVIAQNYICLLVMNSDGKWESKKLFPINGSCIYAVQYSDGYVFSTTVESPEVEGRNKIIAILSRKRGTGILSNQIDLIKVDKKLNTQLIAKFDKDKLPYKLFQYGAVMFPAGQKMSDRLVFYPVAVKGHDGKMGVYKEDI